MTVKDILEFLCGLAPTESAVPDDNVGLLAGRSERELNAVLVALDLTLEVIDEAVSLGAGLIVTHHPVSFGIKRLNDETAEGRRIITLIERGISVISMHTNLDAAENGVNDTLARALLGENAVLEPFGFEKSAGGLPVAFGRIGSLPRATELHVFLQDVKTALNCNGLRVLDAGKPVLKVAVGSGSGGAVFTDAVKAGCDTFVTGDIKHHLWLDAREYSINLIDAGHFPTENVICKKLAVTLQNRWPELKATVSAYHSEPLEFFV